MSRITLFEQEVAQIERSLPPTLARYRERFPATIAALADVFQQGDLPADYQPGSLEVWFQDPSPDQSPSLAICQGQLIDIGEATASGLFALFADTELIHLEIDGAEIFSRCGQWQPPLDILVNLDQMGG
jgi:hypothetical protein